jgi:AraC family transcriptional regulator of adaptative response/methylated-DNA-[protein]-cysteine methyltransferase
MTPFEVCQNCIYRLINNPLLGNDLNGLAEYYALSPSHFQKTFKRYVGISPKQFQQSLIVQQARNPLSQHSLLQTSEILELTSPSRLHDAFVKIQAMSPGEFKSQGDTLTLRYGYEESVFGRLLVVLSERGIFYLGFHTSSINTLSNIKQRFPKAQLIACNDNQLLGYDPFLTPKPIELHVAATNFQVQVWRALLTTQPGQLLSYKDIAQQIGNPKGARGVGQAVGANPVAFLIPCHRVIKQSGAISGYRWGGPAKQALLAWEHASISQ